ncbi:MAG: hypothetical protein ACYC6N_29280, partial [Pirellulaceae bacterium]
QRQLQLERLLRIWSEVRVTQDLFRLVRQFEKAELIPLASDFRSLPTGPDFEQLNREIDRIFLQGTETVAPAEIGTLINRVVERAGFDPDAAYRRLNVDVLSPEEKELYDDKLSPHVDNLRMLKLQIVNDLSADRRDLIEIQYALVGKIALARLHKLAALPLEMGADIDVNAPQMGSILLERILNDLRDGMRLLPETADKIRGTSPSASPTPQR